MGNPEQSFRQPKLPVTLTPTSTWVPCLWNRQDKPGTGRIRDCHSGMVSLTAAQAFTPHSSLSLSLRLPSAEGHCPLWSQIVDLVPPMPPLSPPLTQDTWTAQDAPEDSGQGQAQVRGSSRYLERFPRAWGRAYRFFLADLIIKLTEARSTRENNQIWFHTYGNSKDMRFKEATKAGSFYTF